MSYFVHDRPVYGTGYFHGRQILLRSLISALGKSRSIMLCGGPKTGRTSILYQIMHKVHEHWRRRPTEPKIVPVFMDLAEVASGNERAVVELLYKEITTAVRDPAVVGATPPPPLPKFDLKKESKPWDALHRALEEIWSLNRGKGAWCEYGLLIDNGDLLFSPAHEVTLREFAALGLLKKDWAPASIILAGGRRAREHLLDTEAELSFMRPLFLGAFRRGEAEAIVRGGLADIDEQVLDSLLRSCGNHPYILQRLCAEFEGAGVDLGVGGAVELAAEDCLGLFEKLWDEFDLDRAVTYRGAYAAPEHSLMQLLLDVHQGIELKMAERELGIKPLKEFADFLEYGGVVERNLAGNKTIFRAGFELWNTWYGDRILQ